MARFIWDPDKAEKLRNNKNRQGVSFEDCVIAIEEGRILAIRPHHQKPNQNILILNINHYAYVLPFVIDSDRNYVLKTIFPSRKFTKLYLKKP